MNFRILDLKFYEISVRPCGLNNLKRDRLRMQKKQQQSI